MTIVNVGNLVISVLHKRQTVDRRRSFRNPWSTVYDQRSNSAFPPLHQHIELQLFLGDDLFDPVPLAFLVRRGKTFLQRCDLLQQFDFRRDHPGVFQNRIDHPQFFGRFKIRGQVERLALAFQVVELAALLRFLDDGFH